MCHLTGSPGALPLSFKSLSSFPGVCGLGSGSSPTEYSRSAAWEGSAVGSEKLMHRLLWEWTCSPGRPDHIHGPNALMEATMLRKPKVVHVGIACKCTKWDYVKGQRHPRGLQWPQTPAIPVQAPSDCRCLRNPRPESTSQTHPNS